MSRVDKIAIMGNKHVYILLLNWNGWKDTIECLESIFRLNYNDYSVVVCDNNSIDGSLEYIKAWADGQLDFFVPVSYKLRQLSYPPVPKTIRYKEYGREEVESGVCNYDVYFPLILIRTGENLGFAGGNNVGLRYALARDDFEYVWLLNNDTVVEPDSLHNLIICADAYKSDNFKVGLIGSKLMYYAEPNKVQAIGGIYNSLLGITKHLGSHEHDTGQFDNDRVVSKLDYPVGASMLVPKEFLHEVGLMSEEYFLYFEELDWTLRGKSVGWSIGYCFRAKVYHKEGSTIGSNSNGKEKSELSDFYSLRNRIVFTRKFYPKFLLTVLLSFICVLINRIRRGQLDRVVTVLRALTYYVKH